jgi:hypothetical protein
MERVMKKRLPYPPEAYRLWFEYLRVAKRSSDRKIQEALTRSARFYEPWGNVLDAKFDQWWKEKWHLFEEQFTVRRLARREPPSDPNALVIEVPLTQPSKKLIRQVREIIRLASLEQKAPKRRMRPVTQYKLTEGAKPHLLAFRQMLTVYRDVYLKNKDLRGSELLEKVHAFYLERKKAKKVPAELLPDKYGDNSLALRVMRRYITNAGQVVQNVAKGDFPGKYGG